MASVTLRSSCGCLAGLVALGAFASTPAWALPTGGLFSGPVRPSGASGYYNPAALGTLRGPVTILVETGVISADASYLRAGTSPFDGQPFSEASFSVVAPTLDFSVAFSTPWKPLKWGFSGFTASAASSDWPEDGPQAQHGTDGLFLSYSLVTGPIIGTRKFGFAAMAGPMYTAASLRYAFDYGAYANEEAGAPIFALEDPALLGLVGADTSGWSWGASFGAWFAPTDWIRFGAGFVWLDSPDLQGELEAELPPAFEETFPNQGFRIGGNVSIEYKLPWVLNLETEIDLGPLSLAVFFQYQNKSIGDLNVFVLSEVEPDILDPFVISVANMQDDWQVGGRLSYRLDPSFEFGVRFDVDPLAIPKETIHPVNLDFTSYEMGLGAQWQINDRWLLGGTYAYVYVPDLVVTESIFNPAAPSDSGFTRPSANGTYSVSAMKFLLSLRLQLGS
ncbi:MAG: hypothetical protein AAFZ18_16030 [Myxococcota bacterium]